MYMSTPSSSNRSHLVGQETSGAEKVGASHDGSSKQALRIPRSKGRRCRMRVVGRLHQPLSGVRHDRLWVRRVRLFRGKLRSATGSLLHDILDADGLAIDILHVQPSSDDLTVMDLK